eukprot:1581216-Prymnesium_polylepis.1
MPIWSWDSPQFTRRHHTDRPRSLPCGRPGTRGRGKAVGRCWGIESAIPHTLNTISPEAERLGDGCTGATHGASDTYGQLSGTGAGTIYAHLVTVLPVFLLP